MRMAKVIIIFLFFLTLPVSYCIIYRLRQSKIFPQLFFKSLNSFDQLFFEVNPRVEIQANSLMRMNANGPHSPILIPPKQRTATLPLLSWQSMVDHKPLQICKLPPTVHPFSLQTLPLLTAVMIIAGVSNYSKLFVPSKTIFWNITDCYELWWS